MPSDTTKATAELDNDYVAQILASEARDSSLKYSTQGMGAYLPKRPTGAAPKANTRFLRNIIKETDSHNASLKRKEEREARERMRQLRGQTSSSAHGDRAHDRHRLRYQSDEVRFGRDKREGHDERHRSHRKRHRSTSASPDRDQSRRHRRTHESRGANENYDRSSRKERRQRSISRSRSPRHERSDTRDRHRRHRKRSRSLSRSRSVSPDRHRSQRDQRSSRDKDNGRRTGDHNTRNDRSPRRSKHTREEDISTSHISTSQQKESGYGSDPLEELVGPLPPKKDGFHVPEPIRTRGRGAYKPNASNIDAHFACDYDPTLDVQMEDDDLNESKKPSRRPVAGLMTADDDWELALEALRDRTRWRQKGEERLREAGFNDAVVDRWKHSSRAPGGDDEGRLEDVKWSKKGESREWDRGKFLDDDGHIDVKASW